MLTPSKGAVVKEGQTVEVNYYGVDGRTGKTFDESFSRGTPIAFSLAQVVPGFSKGLVGQRQGSRVVIAMPGADGYDASGGNPQAGIEVGDTLVFVVDLVGVQLAGPEGTAVKPKAGLPTVTTGKDGAPEITVPKTDPPTTLQVQPLIKGKGKKVGENDQITFDYSWVRWSDGKLLEESYSRGAGDRGAVRAAAGHGQGAHRADRGQPGAAGDPAGRRLPGRQPDSVRRPEGDLGDGGRPAVHPGGAVTLTRRVSSLAACRPAAAAARK